MLKLNAILILTLLLCALGVVTAQHEARKHFGLLEKEKRVTDELALELGRLELEQSSLVTHARIEEIARRKLEMNAPAASRTRMISSDYRHSPDRGR